MFSYDSQPEVTYQVEKEKFYLTKRKIYKYNTYNVCLSVCQKKKNHTIVANFLGLTSLFKWMEC